MAASESARRLDHGGWYSESDEPQFWQLAVGAVTGLVVTMLFECYHERGASRVARFASLAGKQSDLALDPEVRRRLTSWINGAGNVADFWTGGFLMSQAKATPEQHVKVFETVALLSALLLTVGVTYYTASTDQHSHMHGIICCVANCALLLGTLMSTFFAVTIGTFNSAGQVDLFVGLIGRILLRGPIALFVIGLALLYSEMVLWFKMTIDAGSSCVICLTACLTMAPLFFHSMHKMGWAVKVVSEQAASERRLAVAPTPGALRARLEEYVESKDGNCLAMDRDEFLEGLDTAGLRATSVQRQLAGRLFDAHVEAELSLLMKPGAETPRGAAAALTNQVV